MIIYHLQSSRLAHDETTSLQQQSILSLFRCNGFHTKKSSADELTWKLGLHAEQQEPLFIRTKRPGMTQDAHRKTESW